MLVDPELECLYHAWHRVTNDAGAAAVLTQTQLQSRGLIPNAADDAPLKPGDVAKLLGVSPHTVLDWINTRQLKASNVATGSRPKYLIQRADLDRFLANRQPEPVVRRRRSA